MGPKPFAILEEMTTVTGTNIQIQAKKKYICKAIVTNQCRCILGDIDQSIMQRESTLNGLHLIVFLALQHPTLAFASVCGITFVFLHFGKSLMVMQPVLDFTLLGQKSFLGFSMSQGSALASKVASISLKMVESTFIFMTSATCHLERFFGKLGVVLLICCFVLKVC